MQLKRRDWRTSARGGLRTAMWREPPGGDAQAKHKTEYGGHGFMRNGSKRLVGSLLLLVAAVPVPSFATSADFNQQMPLGGLHATVATGGHAARFPHRCARFWTGRSIRRRIGSASGRTGSPAMGHGSRRRSGWPCKWVRASVRSIRTAVATIARAYFAGFNMRPIRIQGHVAF